MPRVPEWLLPYLEQGAYEYNEPTFEKNYGALPGVQAHAAYNQQHGLQPVIGYDGQPVVVNPTQGAQFPGQQQGVTNQPVNPLVQRPGPTGEQQYTDIFGSRSGTPTSQRHYPSGNFRLQDWNSFDDLRNRFGEFGSNLRNQFGQAVDLFRSGNYGDLANFQTGQQWADRGYGGPNTRTIAGATGRGYGLSDNSSNEIREAKANNQFYTSSGVNISNVPPGMSTSEFVSNELAKVNSGQGSAYYDPNRAQGTVASLDSRVQEAQNNINDMIEAENNAAAARRQETINNLNVVSPHQTVAPPIIDRQDEAAEARRLAEIQQAADQRSAEAEANRASGGGTRIQSSNERRYGGGGIHRNMGTPNVRPPLDDILGFNKGSMNIGDKVSKIYKEGYTAPGQAFAIAKSMGYNMGTYNAGTMEAYPGESMYATGTDSVKAWLTPGEAVIPASAAQDPMYKPIIKEMIMEGRKDDKMFTDIFNSMDDVTITKKREDGNTVTIKSPNGSLMIDMFK